MNKTFPICVIGAGLAGSECTWQLARRGISVALVEMRPKKFSPAHHSDGCAEMVCSNSLRSDDKGNAVGLLKFEMEQLDSLMIRAARATRVPAGSALAVDREGFADFVTRELRALPHIQHFCGVVTGLKKEAEMICVCLEGGQKINCRRCVVATGPLTDDALAAWISETTGQGSLYFYDAIAPIIEHDSIDMTKAFKANRYQKGNENHELTNSRTHERTMDEGDYINCPMTRDEYNSFVDALLSAELVPVKEFDRPLFFDGCLPIEEMARRGRETLAFGPMKPVGLSPKSNVPSPESGDQKQVNIYETEDRKSGIIKSFSSDFGPWTLDIGLSSPPHAVVQLRQDNRHATLYNMVGFQTRMKHGEQKRIFRMIPGLEHAEFVRLGSMHRNTYLCSPALLHAGLELKRFPGVHFAGQITGCEGYVESAAVGLFVGLTLARTVMQGQGCVAPPQTTALGALIHHIISAEPDNFQPMNINFGLFLPPEEGIKKSARRQHIVSRAETDFESWRQKIT